MSKVETLVFWVVAAIVATGVSIWVDDIFHLRSTGELVVATSLVFVAVYLLAYPLRRGKGLAAISAWAVWALCVFAYDIMFYSNISIEALLILPPACVAAIYLWLSYFIFKPN